MSRQIKIRFYVQATCEQTITVADDCKLTDEQIIDSLNGNGDEAICTSINDKKLYSFNNGINVIGNIDESTLDGAEFSDFETIS